MDNHFQFSKLDDYRIFKQGKALLNQFVMGKIFCREDEEGLFSAIESMIRHKSDEHLLIYGARGSGKTTIMEHLYEQTKNISGVFPFLSNCWNTYTSPSIYNEWADDLGEPISRRGRARDEQFAAICETMSYRNFHGLSMLDEIDGLLFNDDMGVLHDIAGTDQHLFSLIISSTNRNVLAKLHPRLRENLVFSAFEVKPFNRDELLRILEDRATAGLMEDSYESEALEKAAEYGLSKNGNVKYALKLLWKTAEICERTGTPRVTADGIISAHNQIDFKPLILKKEEELITEILKGGGKLSPDLFYQVQKICFKSFKQIYRYVITLEAKGIVEIIPHGKLKYIKLKDGGV